MKKVSIATLLILLICASTASVQAYTNGKHGFSIDPPIGWSVEEPTYAVVVFRGPTEEGFTVNVNIQVETTTASLDEYIDAGKQNLETALENFNLLSEGPRTINNVDAYELVFTFTYYGVTVKEKQVVLMENGKAFIITYAALPTTYQTYLPTFENSVQTFKIAAAGLDWLWILVIGVVVAVVIVVVVVVVVLVTRRRKPPEALPPPPAQQPPPETQPPPPTP